MRLWLLVVATGLYGCSGESHPPLKSQEAQAAPAAPAVIEARTWSSEAHRIGGSIPEGWALRPVQLPGIVSLSHAHGDIQVRALTVDVDFARPDEKMLDSLSSGNWTKISSGRFPLFGAYATRGDFEKSQESPALASTQILWECHEGAPAGKKFVFLAMLVCDLAERKAMTTAFEKFLDDAEMAEGVPAGEAATLELPGGWTARSVPAERALDLGGLRVPSPADPFVRRDVPVAAWLDVREDSRVKREKREMSPADEKAEAVAHYNLALHMLWSQIGASDEVAEGARASARGWLQIFSRMYAGLAANAASVLKLKAKHAGDPTEEFERLRLNASVLEALATVLRGGQPDDVQREMLVAAHTSGCCDYPTLAFALMQDVPPAAMAEALGHLSEGQKQYEAGEYEAAVESGLTAVAATQGRWAEAHRLVAAGQMMLGRLDNAIGSSRNAVVACPGNARLLLDHAEMLIAGGRAAKALELLQEHEGVLRESRREHDLLVDYFVTSALLRQGMEKEAAAAAEALLVNWQRQPSPVTWSFDGVEKNLPDGDAGRDRMLAMHGLLLGRESAESFRANWKLTTPR